MIKVALAAGLFGGVLEAARGGLEWAVLVVAALTAVGVAFRFGRRLLRALERIVDGVGEMLEMVKGNAEQPGLAARLEGLEREVTRFRTTTESLTSLARDESVQDVRDLLRRGRLPRPLVDDDDVAGPGW